MFFGGENWIRESEKKKKWCGMRDFREIGARMREQDSRPPPPPCSGTVYAVIYEVDNTKNRSEPLRGITHA